MALFVVPVAIDLGRGGARRAFSYVAADTFYYLTVSRNLASRGMATFDQVRPTNGFHPLWQACLAAMDALFRGLGADDAFMLAVSVWLSLAFCALSLWLLMRALRAAWGASHPLLPLLPLGVYGFFVAPLWWSLSAQTWHEQNRAEGPLPLYGTLWSFVNGMESSLLLAAFAAMTWFYVARRPLDRTRDAVVLGGLLGAVALSRLDHAAISVAVGAVIAVDAWQAHSRAAYARAALVVFVFALCLAAFVTWSYATCGTPLPTSGTLKSTFPHVHRENFDRLRDAWHGLFAGRRNLNVEWRLAQLCVPAVAALLSVPLLVRMRLTGRGIALSMARPHDRLDPILLATAVSTLVMVGYVWLFVRGGHQGHWYFPVSVMFVSLIALRVPGPGWAKRLVSSPHRRGVVTALLAMLALVHFLRFQAPSDYHARYAHFFFDEAPAVRAYFLAAPPKLLSIDDGIVAFATGFPTMNALGLTLDPEGVRAKLDGTLLQLAVARGYDAITSLVYAPLGGLSPRATTTRIARYLGAAPDYRFEVIYRHPSSDFGIVRAHKR